MGAKALVLLAMLTAKQPLYREVAPWQFRQIGKQLAGQRVRVREVVGRVGTGRWSPQLDLMKFRRQDWLKIASRKGWSPCFYLVSIHNTEALYAAHRLLPGDRCTIYGRVVGTPVGLMGGFCVVVDKIEPGRPEQRSSARQGEATFCEGVGP